MYSTAQHYKDVAGMVKNDIKDKIPRSQAGPYTNQFPTDYTREYRAAKNRWPGEETRPYPASVAVAVGTPHARPLT
jgi:hypothetical protein